MPKSTDVCNSCFPDGSVPHCRVFDTGAAALRSFSALFAIGRMPTMCQQGDHRYRVCVRPAPEMPSGVKLGDDRKVVTV